jgi:hypothetical protein
LVKNLLVAGRSFVDILSRKNPSCRGSTLTRLVCEEKSTSGGALLVLLCISLVGIISNWGETPFRGTVFFSVGRGKNPFVEVLFLFDLFSRENASVCCKTNWFGRRIWCLYSTKIDAIQSYPKQELKWYCTECIRLGSLLCQTHTLCEFGERGCLDYCFVVT